MQTVFVVLDDGEDVFCADHEYKVENPNNVETEEYTHDCRNVMTFLHFGDYTAYPGSYGDNCKYKTYVPIAERTGYLHLNPGSLSLPKEGSCHGYIVYEDRTFTFKSLDGKQYDKVIV
ncbi:MAG: hypothetical protein LUI60_00070 [Clostridia bacterium]|nr:hypothetical protein [Clostridia bacterium]